MNTRKEVKENKDAIAEKLQEFLDTPSLVNLGTKWPFSAIVIDELEIKS